MRITIQKIGQDIITDITDKFIHDFDQGEGVWLTQEKERDAFERVVSDLKLRFDDSDGMFSTMFADSYATDLFKVKLYPSTTCQFVGFLNLMDCNFDVEGKYFEATVLASIKRFWEVAEKTKLDIQAAGLRLIPLEYVALSLILQHELHRPVFHNIISLAVIPALYGDEEVRGWADSTTNTVGNNGKYGNLDPATTIKEFLFAIAAKFNIEYYIDPETESFIFHKREESIGVNAKTFSQILMDDPRPQLKLSDGKRYDYVKSIYSVLPIISPELLSLSWIERLGDGYAPAINPRDVSMMVCFYMTITVQGKESQPSPALVVSIPGTQYGKDGNNNKKYTACSPNLRIPISPIDCEFRTLYRNIIFDNNDPKYAPEWGRDFSKIFYRAQYSGNGSVIEVNDNKAWSSYSLNTAHNIKWSSGQIGDPYTTIQTDAENKYKIGDLVTIWDHISTPSINGNHTIIDVTSKYNFVIKAETTGFVGASGSVQKTEDMVKEMPNTGTLVLNSWIRYNEAAGLWDVPIYADKENSNQPGGLIFDSAPKLTFIDPNTSSAFTNQYDQLLHFFKSTSEDSVKANFIDLFMTKRILECSVDADDILLGQEIVDDIHTIHPLLSGKQLVVKKAETAFTEKTTKLILTVQ